MRGHENIIAMRMKGVKPAGAVLVCDYQVNPSFLEWRYSDDRKNPTVCTHGTQVSAIDFRFVVGLPVHVHGDSVSRVKQIAGACKKAGAESVAAQAGDMVAFWKKGDAQWQTF